MDGERNFRAIVPDEVALELEREWLVAGDDSSNFPGDDLEFGFHDVSPRHAVDCFIWPGGDMYWKLPRGGFRILRSIVVCHPQFGELCLSIKESRIRVVDPDGVGSTGPYGATKYTSHLHMGIDGDSRLRPRGWHSGGCFNKHHRIHPVGKSR